MPRCSGRCSSSSTQRWLWRSGGSPVRRLSPASLGSRRKLTVEGHSPVLADDPRPTRRRLVGQEVKRQSVAHRGEDVALVRRVEERSSPNQLDELLPRVGRRLPGTPLGQGGAL